MRRSRARRYCSEDTGCPCQEEDQETARGGIGCRAGERAGRIGLGRAAAAAPAPSSNEGAASATNYPWPEPPSAKQ
jgi:hypothetical protein